MSETTTSTPAPVGIVTVLFHSKYGVDGFGGRPYTYRTAIPLEVGEVVRVPTKRGPGQAKVAQIGLTEGDLAPGIDYLTITEKDPDCDKQDSTILEAWDRWERFEPDASTERLFALVEDDTGYDPGNIGDTLYRRRRGGPDHKEGDKENGK